MTTELTDFLFARVEEDEVKATLRDWHAVDCRWFPDDAGYTYPCDCGVPERLKADCEAKRRIVEHHPASINTARSVCLTCWDARASAHRSAPCSTLRALALPYADHPDYDEEWRP